MENIIDSNERTLVIFDSVCSGLVECLSLVHSDIKQMTKHRNRLTLIQREQELNNDQQQRLQQHQHQQLQQNQPTNYLLGMEGHSDNINCPLNDTEDYYATCNVQLDQLQSPQISIHSPKPDYDDNEPSKTNSTANSPIIEPYVNQQSSQLAKSKQNSCSALLLNIATGKRRSSSGSRHSRQHNDNNTFTGNNLEGLELLDKQLAESFSQAFNMNDQYKSSILAKENILLNNHNHLSSQNNQNSNYDNNSSNHQSKPSIFQVLLGKPWSLTSSSSSSSTATRSSSSTNGLNNGSLSPILNSASNILSTGQKNNNDARKRSDSEKLVISNYESDLSLKKQQFADNKLIIDDINKQIRLAMQYSKQLEAHLLKIEDLRSKYEMHLKMGLVVRGVSRAYNNNNKLTTTTSASATASKNCANMNHPLSPSLSCSLINELTPINDMKKQQIANNYSHDSHQQYILMQQHQQQQHHQQQHHQQLPDPNNYHHCQQQQQQQLYQRCNGDANINMINCHQQQQHQHSMNSQYLAHNQHLNDSSSLGTHSSLSSLNLTASWSSSKSKRHGQQLQPNNHYDNFCHQQQHQLSPDHSMLTYSDMINSLARSQSNHHLHASLSSLKRSFNNDPKSRDLMSDQRIQQTANLRHQHQLTKSAAGQSKTTIKEFIENIDKLEAEFESHLGSFLFSIEDIQGFARVCQGDTFEISIKYGDSQKFKTRINVLKGNRQKCDNRQAVFKSRIADRLAIKAYECKGLGKRILLGHKLCETRDLFTARSQLMTISLNQTGSIKLNLIVTWNPLHLAPNNGPSGVDISHISLSDTPIYS